MINNTIKVVAVDNDSVINYEFYYPIHSYAPAITGYVNAQRPQELRYHAADGFRVHGRLEQIVTDRESVLTGNFHYGFYENLALQNHFEGTLAIFPETPPHPGPPEPDEADTDDFAPALSISAPLFPYIAVQPWPKEIAPEEALSFFRYNPAHTGADSLYSQLVTLAAAKDRPAMEQLCLAFLQNMPPFAGQYYADLQAVPYPFGLFPAIYDELTDTQEMDHAHLLPAIHAEAWQEIVDRLWQNYFALAVIPGFNETFAVELNKVLLVYNLLEKIYGAEPPPLYTPAQLQQLLSATILLPATVFPLPPAPASPPYAPHPGNRISPYAIGELKMSRYRLLRYQPGEIAAIQNVMKGEQRKVTQRQLNNSSEHSAEQTTHAAHTDTQYREASSDLLLEAKKTLAGYTKTTTYNNFNTTYGPPTLSTLNGSVSEQLTAGDNGLKTDSSFMNRVLNSTINRISENVSRIRASSKHSESEAITSSIFDNRDGRGHFRGIYRWLNKIYCITVENYGYRFLLELQLQQPAAEYIRSQQSLNALDLQKPLSPAEQGIRSLPDLTPENYISLLSYYQLDNAILPPEEQTWVSTVLSTGETEKYVQVPEHYEAVSATVSGIIAAGAPLQALSGIVGSAIFHITDKEHTCTLELENESGALAVSAIAGNTPASPPYEPTDFILNIKIKCKRADTQLNEWKARAYKQLQDAFQQRLHDYLAALSRLAGEQDQSNPELLRQTERAALRQRCVALLLEVCSTKTGLPPQQLEVNRPRYLQFFGEVLEWDEMSWHFDDSLPAHSYALQGRNDSLRPFLQAQGARVLLPVRPDRNYQLLYYLSAGMLWQAPYPFIPVNEADTAIAAHLKAVASQRHPLPLIERSWEIALPTAMQVIQEDSRLPVFSSCKDHPSI